MARRKTTEDEVVVSGSPDEWLLRIERALTAAGFTKVQVSEKLGQARGRYRTMTLWGQLLVTVTPEDIDHARIRFSATANVDNIYAAFRPPGRAIIERVTAEIS